MLRCLLSLERLQLAGLEARLGEEARALALLELCVPALAVSACGKQIVSVGDDNDPSVALWASSSGDWRDGKRVATSKGDKRPSAAPV